MNFESIKLTDMGTQAAGDSTGVQLGPDHDAPPTIRRPWAKRSSAQASARRQHVLVTNNRASSSFTAAVIATRWPLFSRRSPHPPFCDPRQLDVVHAAGLGRLVGALVGGLAVDRGVRR